MHDSLIQFGEFDWSVPIDGARQKSVTRDGTLVRLVEFAGGFVEEDWCTAGHVGYILEGRIFVDFQDYTSEFRAGDGIHISPGERSRHRAHVKEGEKALLFLVETVM